MTPYEFTGSNTRNQPVHGHHQSTSKELALSELISIGALHFVNSIERSVHKFQSRKSS